MVQQGEKQLIKTKKREAKQEQYSEGKNVEQKVWPQNAHGLKKLSKTSWGRGKKKSREKKRKGSEKKEEHAKLVETGI